MGSRVVQALVGAGGWGYFPGGLPGYARAFAFAEVNASFYREIPEAQARRWRAAAPEGFTFAVKASRDVTHRDGLRASPAGRSSFAHAIRLAGILRAPYVILQTPASLRIGERELSGLRDLLGLADPSVRLGLEARAHRNGRLPPGLRSLMEDAGILDVVDLSRGRPRVNEADVYSRLFGPGPANVYEFDDDELRGIDRAGCDAVRVAFTFHGVRMHKDAARFLTFRRTGEFPSATRATGVASLEEVLRPDARFPASRDALARDHGWKVIDLDPRTRAHAERLLERLPARTFEDLEAVARALAAGGFSRSHDGRRTWPTWRKSPPVRL